MGQVFNLPSFKLGRLFGIPLEINPTWLIIFVLISSTLSFSYYPAAFPGRTPFVNVVSGVLTALLFFASIVLHELSHSLVARTGGIRVKKVTLFMFGGVAQMEDEPASPSREFVMAVAGPLMSFLLAAVFFLGYVGLSFAGITDTLWAPLQYLAFINLAVGIFNLLPGFPLDGGRVLRSILWGITGDHLKATLWASRAGQFIGYSMVALAVIGVVQGVFDLIWFGLIGWFIATLAEGSYRQEVVKTTLEGVEVRSIMSPDPMTAPGVITLERLAEDYFLGGRHSRYPVQVDGSVIGLVSLREAKRVPREEWPVTHVADVTDTDLSRLVVDSSTPVEAVFQRLAVDEPGALLVVEDGRVVGIVTRADVLSRIRRAAL